MKLSKLLGLVFLFIQVAGDGVSNCPGNGKTGPGKCCPPGHTHEIPRLNEMKNCPASYPFDENCEQCMDARYVLMTRQQCSKMPHLKAYQNEKLAAKCQRPGLPPSGPNCQRTPSVPTVSKTNVKGGRKLEQTKIGSTGVHKEGSSASTWDPASSCSFSTFKGSQGGSKDTVKPEEKPGLSGFLCPNSNFPASPNENGNICESEETHASSEVAECHNVETSVTLNNGDDEEPLNHGRRCKNKCGCPECDNTLRNLAVTDKISLPVKGQSPLKNILNALKCDCIRLS